ncbi:E3 ubiquitin-protein ligase MARCHF2-like [Hippocampus zosterae]|uniref:E3 ubiquitin-protein ligase MARCHF2-like n=1 Tax=Hippocampus zosterae TaxID=109293 RepID=UPI00223C915E|nr:E3 ubiquitin-protein ligase MARCHF2-like [Hippocampus zosterae]
MTTGGCCHLPDAQRHSPKDIQGSVEEEGGSNGGEASEWPADCAGQVTIVDGHSPSSVIKTLPSDAPICRICHEGGCAEVLLSPCDCTGTLATVHKSCLELWLASSNTNFCELCNARFIIQRRLRPFTEWLRDPGSYEERRLVFCDIICFLFVTPLATISGWLCLKGVKDDLQLGSLLQNTGLISLTLVLFTIYSLWTMVCLRFHCKLYSEWRRKDQQVHLIIPKAKEVVCSQHALLSTTTIHMPSDDSLV